MEVKDIEFKKIEELSKEELIELIIDKDLKLVKVLDVKQGDMGTYKAIYNSTKELEEDIRIFGLTIEDEEYKLLDDEEIKYIYKEGRYKW